MSDNYTSQINAAFEALKYNPHATQQLLQQQQKNPGGAQGPETLAAAAAANYQKSMQAPPPQQPPQQTVVAGLTQQPQMPMGLEAPYLEDFAQQQHQQRMATGGIVALAGGGPVQGYAGGGSAGRSAVNLDDILRNTTFEDIPHEGGTSPIVDLSGRKITVANIYGKKIPFYVSTGSGGKANVPEGKWYPYFGHGEGNGWFNKGISEKHIANYYDSPILEDVAKHLDNTLGDIRYDTHALGQEIPKISKSSQAVRFINEGLNPVGGSMEEIPARMANINSTLDSVHNAVLNAPERFPAQTPASQTPAQTPVSDMMAKLSESAKAKLRGMNPTDAAAEMRRLTPGWTEGEIPSSTSALSKYVDKAGEAIGPYLSKAGKVLSEASPFAWALDPRVQAANSLYTGAARGSNKDILEGMAQLNSSDSSLEGLDWLVQHGNLGERLGFAAGGVVRGFDDGGLLRSLTGQRQSPGARLYEGIRNLFGDESDVNPAISRDEWGQRRSAPRAPIGDDVAPENTRPSPLDATGLSEAVDTINQTPDFSYMDRRANPQMPKIDLSSPNRSAQLANYGVTPFSEGDTSAPQEPKPKPELEAPKKADGSHLSYEDQINYVQKILGTPPDVSAEIKGQLEKRMAHEGNVNLIKDIAAGIGGFLGTRGYGQERVGAGIMNALQSSAIHGKEESDMQDKIDALQLKSTMQPYESRHQAATLFLQNQQKLREAQAAAAAKQAELSYERGTKFGTEQLQGEYGLRKEGLQGTQQVQLEEMKARAAQQLEAVKAALEKAGGPTMATKASLLKAYQEAAAVGLIRPEEIATRYNADIATITGSSAPQAAPAPLGGGLFLSTP